jgi:hypothetical protein
MNAFRLMLDLDFLRLVDKNSLDLRRAVLPGSQRNTSSCRVLPASY